MTTIVLDKTGTLTKGEFKVSEVQPSADKNNTIGKEELLENGIWHKLKIVLYLFNVIQLNKVGVRYFSFILFVCPSDMMRYIGCITSEFQYGNNIRLY